MSVEASRTLVRSPLAGIPERTYRRWLARLRDGEPIKGPWPTPVVDEIEANAAKYAESWLAWGHRKIAALMRADGHVVSTSTVGRALRRRGLLLPRGFRADRKSWSAIRRRVFHDPSTERNRVWQTDFSEFEAAAGGIWRICAVIDFEIDLRQLLDSKTTVALRVVIHGSVPPAGCIAGGT